MSGSTFHPPPTQTIYPQISEFRSPVIHYFVILFATENKVEIVKSNWNVWGDGNNPAVSFAGIVAHSYLSITLITLDVLAKKKQKQDNYNKTTKSNLNQHPQIISVSLSW